ERRVQRVAGRTADGSALEVGRLRDALVREGLDRRRSLLEEHAEALDFHPGADALEQRRRVGPAELRVLLRDLLDRGARSGAGPDVQVDALGLVEAFPEAVVEGRVLTVGHPDQREGDLLQFLGAGAARRLLLVATARGRD